MEFNLSIFMKYILYIMFHRYLNTVSNYNIKYIDEKKDSIIRKKISESNNKYDRIIFKKYKESNFI